MSVPAIIFNGYELWHPGSYTKYDITKLNRGAPASRTLVYLGEADSGIPYNATDFNESERINVISSGSEAKNVLRGGKLYLCSKFALTPSKDPGVNPPQRVIALVVNPLTRASKILKESTDDKITVKSYIYGKLANDVRISVSDGTTEGKMLKIAFNDEYAEPSSYICICSFVLSHIKEIPSTPCIKLIEVLLLSSIAIIYLN